MEARAPHLSFMLQKQYWFREIYLGLKVTIIHTFQPMHGLKLVIKEDVVPQEQLSIKKLAAKGLSAVEIWNSKRAMINFKATVEVPMLGSMIERCGDTLDESHRVAHVAGDHTSP